MYEGLQAPAVHAPCPSLTHSLHFCWLQKVLLHTSHVGAGLRCRALREQLKAALGSSGSIGMAVFQDYTSSRVATWQRTKGFWDLAPAASAAMLVLPAGVVHSRKFLTAHQAATPQAGQAALDQQGGAPAAEFAGCPSPAAAAAAPENEWCLARSLPMPA